MSDATKYTPQELARMTGEAMIAWSENPNTKTQSWDGNKWQDPQKDNVPPFFKTGAPAWAYARRIKPAPRKVPLDQSDFVGPNRVTHARYTQYAMYAVICVSQNTASFIGDTSVSFDKLRDAWQVSRDNGLTWGAAEKEVES